MKIIFLFILMSFIQVSIKAQTYTLSPNDTVEMTLILNTYTDLNINHDRVNMNDTITLGYNVVYNDIPASWDKLLCVYGLCVGSSFPVGTSGLMNPLKGGNRGFTKLTINPLSLDQSAKLRVYIYDVDAPNDGDTLTYMIHSTLPLTYLEKDNSVSIYPNPATTEIQLESSKDWISVVEICNTSGQLLKSLTGLHSKSLSVDVSDLSQGVYFVKMRSDNNAIRLQKLIIQ